MRGLAVVLLLTVATEVALVHGSTFRRAPPLTGYWKRGIPCSCAKVECDKCTPRIVRSGEEISRCSTKVTELNRWGDIAQVRVTVTFETKRELDAIEGFVSLRPAPVFAAVSGRVESVTSSSEARFGSDLKATLMDSEKARRTYLWTRRRYRHDPLLVLWRGPGEIHVRAFPVSKRFPLRVVIYGYALLPRDDLRGIRLYRTGRRFMAVGGKDGPCFLFGRECRARHGTVAAVEVPCVAHLESAAKGHGRAAASNDVALAAFPAGAVEAPLVGPDVWVSRTGMSPGHYWPAYGEPPPPAPTVTNNPNDPGPPPSPPTRMTDSPRSAR